MRKAAVSLTLGVVTHPEEENGALYDALAVGRIDDERLLSLLAEVLPPLVDGTEARAWIAEHDVIDRRLLDRGVPPADAARSGTPAPAGGGCGSRSTRLPVPGRTRGAPRAGSTSTTARALPVDLAPARRLAAKEPSGFQTGS